MRRWTAPLAVALLGASGCAAVTNRVITDSLGVQSEQQIRAVVPDVHADTALSRGLVLRGWKDGQQTTSGREAISVHAPLVPRDGWLIIQLGANDVEFDAPARWSTNIRAALADAGPTTCVAWVLPSNGRTAVMAARSAAFSQLVVAELRKRVCAVVIDWPTWVRVWPDLLADDRLHVSDAGQRVLALLMRDAVALRRGNHVPADWPPSTTISPTAEEMM